MTALSDVQSDDSYKQYLDHGFVALLETMGSDITIEQSARMSYQKGTRVKSETRTLLRYLMRHHHTSPFEMAEVRFHLKLPIFIMRQLVRHRTANLNEWSGRYSEMTDEFYFPTDDRIQGQSTTNKQGSANIITGEKQLTIKNSIQFIQDASYENYERILENGMSRELARIVLPVSNYTELVWKCDLNNFFKFLRLRLDSHAQKEIQDLAQLMYDAVKPLFPIACEAFEDYQLYAKTFSRVELKILQDVLGSLKNQMTEVLASYDTGGPNSSHFSKREIDEFKAKLNLV